MPLFVWADPFERLVQKFFKKISSSSEINWPVAILQIDFLRIDHCEFGMQAVGNHYDGFIELEKIMTHTH